MKPSVGYARTTGGPESADRIFPYGGGHPMKGKMAGKHERLIAMPAS